MRMPRRKFLASSLVVGASAALMLGDSSSVFAEAALNQVDDIPSEALQDPVMSFTVATFKPYVGDYFQARNSRGQAVALKLLKAQSFKARNRITSSSIETNSFLLLFSSEERLPPFTSIHTIEHGALGQFDLFLTPRTGTNGELFYEAVVNHIY